jgi:glyoxylase-like metal-dependent hydrolase (beta-lactamase superfamily II)
LHSAFLITEEGVLVVDTRQHPRDGRDLLDRIRKITDKPIKWVVNTHFHGDHTYGNSEFKAVGADIVAHVDTARIMAQVAEKEFDRRQPFFKKAVAEGVPLDTAIATLDFSPYKDWHNYTRRGNDIKGLYELIQTGQRSYFR